MTGCVVNGAPAVVPAGCVRIDSCVAAPGATVNVCDVTGVIVPAENVTSIVVATLCWRLVNVATPLTAVAVSAPVSVPEPVGPRAAVIVVELSDRTRLPAPSKTRTTGWVVNAPPAAARDGCVSIAIEAGTPATSVTFDVIVGLPVVFDVKVSVRAPMV